jgi:hypothetical protein
MDPGRDGQGFVEGEIEVVDCGGFCACIKAMLDEFLHGWVP